MSLLPNLTRLSLRACASALPLLFATHALANDVYVNPQTGDDINGLGTKGRPFQTLHHAIGAIGGSGVVRAMPGIYADSPAYNNEVFPLNLPQHVALQGVGAKECVIRRLQVGLGTPGHNFVVLPRNQASHPNTDTAYPIVDCSFSGNSYADTFIEGFTFQGGQVQIYSYPEAAQSVRISNCVFDLRSGGDESLPGPEFGILLTSVYQITGPGCSGGFYPDLQYHILNNTFIGGYEMSTTSTDLSIQSCVALCNSNDPALWAGCPDPNPTIRGVSNLNVQNNLFRILPNQVARAMLGVDSSDTTAAVGVAPPGYTLPCPSNAFDPADTGGFSADTPPKWFSGFDVGKSPPTTILAIDRSATPRVDPGFVGEMIGQTQTGLTYPHVRDWRLLQTSALKDIGTTPVITSGIVQIGATDGTTFVESNLAVDQAFDWDGEGYGNPRVVGGVIDVGFDEIDGLMIAGSYGSDSKSHGYPYDPKVTPGNIQRTYIKQPGFTVALYTSMQFYIPGKAYDTPPGTVRPPVSPPFGTGNWYLATPYNASPPMVWTFVQWTNPVDGYLHNVNQALMTFNDYPPPYPVPAQMYLNTQAMVGNTAANLQAEIR